MFFVSSLSFGKCTYPTLFDSSQQSVMQNSRQISEFDSPFVRLKDIPRTISLAWIYSESITVNAPKITKIMIIKRHQLYLSCSIRHDFCFQHTHKNIDTYHEPTLCLVYLQHRRNVNTFLLHSPNIGSNHDITMANRAQSLITKLQLILKKHKTYRKKRNFSV